MVGSVSKGGPQSFAALHAGHVPKAGAGCLSILTVHQLRYDRPRSSPSKGEAPVNQDISAEFQRRFPAVSAELGPDNLARLLDACSVVTLPPGRKLFRDRMPVDSLFLVLEGDLQASVGDGSKTLELGHIGPGDWLGEVAVLSGEMLASSTVSTLTRCRALKMHARDFENLVIHDPDISHVLLGQLVDLLARRLRESNAGAARLG